MPATRSIIFLSNIFLLAPFKVATHRRKHAGRTLARWYESRLFRGSTRTDTIGGSVLRRSRHEYEQVRLPSVLLQPLARVEIVEKRHLGPGSASLDHISELLGSRTVSV